MKELTMFEEKAIDDLALSLLDFATDRSALPDRLESVARLLGCTAAQLVVYLQPVLCSVMTHPRTTDLFGQSVIDMELAKGWLAKCRRESRGCRIEFEPEAALK